MLKIKITALLIVIILAALPLSIEAAQTSTDTPESYTIYIEWYFRTYAAPDFMAEVIAYFQPQPITVHELKSNGWALLSTGDNQQWVYTNRHRRFIDRRMGLFAEIADSEFVGVVSPQVVSVLATDGDWFLGCVDQNREITVFRSNSNKEPE